ncbi:hypothetical protein [Micromonospora tarensis]|uniref:Uncharacterized protein n=1 Tax=Micromonospora tarensis TaxID=2806100 RepID=A0ABS1YQT7_9ACTN|nr:hypothetical protein [Micromonospora tarensis]MBM0279810.1 hypothetical protein [Micromonospora tarensis]
MQPAVPPGDQPTRHQHDTGLRRCCDQWPPANRITTVGTVLADRRRLMYTATYAGWLLLALVAAAAVHALLLPATTAWAAAHGLWGWALWLIWAVASLAALHQGVLARRRSRTAVYVLHTAAVTGALMAIAAPGGWIQALAATAGTAGAWLIAYGATRR